MILVVDISKDIVRETGVEFVKWPLNKPFFFLQSLSSLKLQEEDQEKNTPKYSQNTQS